MKSGIRLAIGHLAYRTGLIALVRKRWPRQGAVILMGHRVRDDEEAFFGGIPPGTFERQIRYLKRHYRFLSMTRLVELIREKRPLPSNSVVLTFDDGWRDNYTNAFPILRDNGVPATIYLVTRSLDQGELPWPQRVGYILQRTEATEVTLPAAVGRSFPLSTTRQRRQALQAIKELRKSLPMDRLEEMVRDLAKRCNVEPPTDRMLTWDHVREMREHDIEFGAHTVSHPLMAFLPIEEARRELVESKRAIERELGEPVRHLAFPGGSSNRRLVELAREVGFESLFVTDRIRRVNSHRSDPFALRRLGTTSDPAPVMAAEMAGLFDWFRAAARRR